MLTLAPLVRFARPHTIIATGLQVITMLLIVAGPRLTGPATLGALILALTACLALNLFVVGVNQITDVAIDRVNKPWLPVAADQISPADAQRLSLGAAALSLGAAALAGPYLLATVLIIMLIGAAYSLPPLRLKRFPVAAALSIALARGFLANVGLALHFGQVFGAGLHLASALLIGGFFFGFGLVIALYKDMPDAAGDRLHRIETFTTRLGAGRVLGYGRLLLTLCYGLPIGLALWQLPQPGALYLLVSHLLIIAGFWIYSARVNLARQRSIANFYTFLWTMFYAEFVLLGVYGLARGVA